MLMPYTGIRRFGEEDLPEVADLHRRVLRMNAPAPAGWMQAYQKYFGEVFLSEAAVSAGLPSLVYQREGRILGFLGVMPRRMQFQGRSLLAAVCSQFVVDPAERGQAGLQMLKRCFAGNQDVSISDEAGECTRKIWEWCGGTAALPYSIHWIRPLRPAQAALMMAGATDRVARVLSPLARAVDAIATRPLGRLRPAPPTGSRAMLDDATLLGCLAEVAGQRSFAPAYDEKSVAWALERARRHVDHGPVRALAVRDESHAMIGWFVYHARRRGPGEVLQIAAQPRHQRSVLDHLFEDAWQQGVTVLAGRHEPALAPQLSEQGCLLYRRGYWTLVQSRRPEICHALQRGDAFFTRLEGEWCLRFS
jgi:hypothetical protein